MFAEVITDLTNKAVDRTFTYEVPEELCRLIGVGSPVRVPFGAGNSLRKGYVMNLADTTDVERSKIKAIDSIESRRESVNEELISLAVFMRHRYGGTLYANLQAVLPVKTNGAVRKKRFFLWKADESVLQNEIATAEKKKYHARERFLAAFLENRRLPAEIVTDRLKITPATIRKYLESGDVEIEEEAYRKKSSSIAGESVWQGKEIVLNDEQLKAVDEIERSDRTMHVLFGVTGSGKTEVYMELLEHTLCAGGNAIVLIPEIALTYQTVMRFYDRFGDDVTFVHSKLSENEKAERFADARNGAVRIMIGPRSALFTPFENLKLIIVDEFHETSYDSDKTPKYRSVEVAEERARRTGAKVVLGSATPSVEWYKKALEGEAALHKLTKRAVRESVLPDTYLVDMREELKTNRSIFSHLLSEKIEERLARHEQIMLFLNRRGYSGAVSCRSCGNAVTCVHCSTSLNYHKNGVLKCHICGYERPMIKVCPVCGSSAVGTFGIGTEKVEELVHTAFPGARTLRMDADTTARKNGHETIIEAFSRYEADILIGTQMIVKGHDFPRVTLVGILCADLSLYIPDYRSAERTFELLTQAEGRAGRGRAKGECVIQTYNPEHYAIRCAKDQDFEAFYREEIAVRKALFYPPESVMRKVRISGRNAEEVRSFTESMTGRLSPFFMRYHITVLGPSQEIVFRVKDAYRYQFYLKTDDLNTMSIAKNEIEKRFREWETQGRLYLSFES